MSLLEGLFKGIRAGAQGYQGQEQLNLAEALRRAQMMQQQDQFNRRQTSSDFWNTQNMAADTMRNDANVDRQNRRDMFNQFKWTHEQAANDPSMQAQPAPKETEVKGRLLQALIDGQKDVNDPVVQLLFGKGGGKAPAPVKKPTVTGGTIASFGEKMAPTVGKGDDAYQDYGQGLHSAFTHFNRMGMVPGFEFINGLPPANMPDFSKMTEEELNRLANGG